MWLILFILVVSSSVYADTLSGIVVKVTDGDSLAIMQGLHKYTIRLAGVDCPEQKQSFGMAAKQYTATLAFQQKVSVVTTERDRYGRWIGVVVLRDGRVLNHTLVDEGLCMVFTAYNKDPVLRTLESQAREFKRGLWQEPNPIPPWIFRKQKP